MDKSTLIITDGLSPALGFAVIGALGLAMLALALAVRSMIRTTDDYVAAGRRIGLGFGVALGDCGVDVVGGRADFGCGHLHMGN